MAESKHDDLADALARMAAGDIAPSEHEISAPDFPPIEPPTQPATRPASKPAVAARPSPPVSPKPAATVPAKPIAPAARPAAAPRTAVPSAVPRSAVPSAPPPAPAARPARPSTPTLVSAPVRAPAPVVPPVAPARPQRPAAPTIRQVEPTDFQSNADADLSTAVNDGSESEIFDDEDAVIMPAPEPSAFIPKPKPVTSADARAKIAAKKKLEYRRTLIPILLTVGVLSLVFAGLKFCLGQDSPITALPIWVPVVLAIAGCVLLTFAVMNMLGVKAELAKVEAK